MEVEQSAEESQQEEDNSQHFSSEKDSPDSYLSQSGNKNNSNSRSYAMNDNGQYERVIRKRKRKSGD